MPLLLLLLLILLLFLKKNPELKKIYFIATLAHLLILASIYLFLNPGFLSLANDGHVCSNHAGAIALLLKDINISDQPSKFISFRIYKLVYELLIHGVIPQASQYSIGYITYFYSVIYAAYGYNPVYIIISNIILNLLTGAIIFKICDMLFNRKTAFMALVLFLFNPVSLYYTTTLAKESMYFLAFYLSIYLAILSVQKRNIVYFLLLIPPLFFIKALKGMLFKPFLLVLAIYFTVSFFSKKKFLFIVAPILAVLFFIQFDFMYAQWQDIFSTATEYARGYTWTSKGYNYDHLKFGNYSIPLQHNTGKIMYIANSWYHLISEPIFQKNLTFGLLAYYPFKVIFLLLSVSSVVGVYISFRHNNCYHRENLLLLSFLFIIGSGLALASGNVGTMLRHRDIITPVIFIYAAYFFSVLNSKFKLENYSKSTG